MAGDFDTHSKAINNALAALFDTMKRAEKDGFRTHIYVPEGSGSEVAGMASVDLARSHRYAPIKPRRGRKKP